MTIRKLLPGNDPTVQDFLKFLKVPQSATEIKITIDKIVSVECTYNPIKEDEEEYNPIKIIVELLED